MYLIDTNVWVELLLEQDRSQQVRSFFEAVSPDQLAISEFSIYSVGIILTRLKKDEVFGDFLSDILDDTDITVVRLDADGLKKPFRFARSSTWILTTLISMPRLFSPVVS